MPLTESVNLVLKNQSVAATDTNINDVALLLHGNGANNSTSIIDSSLSPKTITAVGDAKISTLQSKFGVSSIAFDGNGDYLSLTMPGGLGDSTFTLEFFYYKTANSGMLFNSRLAGVGGDGIDIGHDLRTTTNAVQFFAGATVATNQWVHVAIVRLGSAMSRYINGTLDGTSSTTNNFNSTAFLIGGSNVGNTGYLNGYIDEFRLTKNVARYTANFTPPTAPFPDF